VTAIGILGCQAELVEVDNFIKGFTHFDRLSVTANNNDNNFFLTELFLPQQTEEEGTEH